MKICIIKLGADGDVLRTLPVVKAIHEKYNEAQISWVTKPSISELLKGLHYINSILHVGNKITENFDILYNFDIDEQATSLSLEIKADKKYGFSKNEGFVSAFNIGAEYYLSTIFDDEVKKTNKKTYQEMMFEVAELPYKKEIYSINLFEKDLEYAKNFIKSNNIHNQEIIGIHMGASDRWPSKVWHKECIKEFIKKANSKNYKVILFGGPNERESHKLFIQELANEKIIVYQNNPENTKREFASLVNLCKAMICSDSFALHLSIGIGKKTIGLFFCTPPNEVEPYGLMTKLTSPRINEFFPEKMDQYNEELTKSIKPEDVLAEVERIPNENK